MHLPRDAGNAASQHQFQCIQSCFATFQPFLQHPRLLHRVIRNHSLHPGDAKWHQGVTLEELGLPYVTKPMDIMTNIQQGKYSIHS